MNAARDMTVQVEGITARELVIFESSSPLRAEDSEVTMLVEQETPHPNILPLRNEDAKVAALDDKDASEPSQPKGAIITSDQY